MNEVGSGGAVKGLWVKRTVSFEYEVPMANYPNMTVEEARAFEYELGIPEIIGIMESNPDTLDCSVVVSNMH